MAAIRTFCSALFGSSIGVYVGGGHRTVILVIALVSLWLLAVIPNR